MGTPAKAASCSPDKNREHRRNGDGNLEEEVVQKELSHLGRSMRRSPLIRHCTICGHPSLFLRISDIPYIGIRCVRCRSTAIHRALYRALQARFGARLAGLRGCRVYEASAHGAFFRKVSRMSGRAGFELWSSEFYDGWVPGQYYGGVRCENLERLTFDDAMFDLVTSSEVMEHVEDLDRAMAEIRRVLKPGGWCIFSVPIDMTRDRTVSRARRADDGTRTDLLPPEYHGDPVRGERGVFTWRTFGADTAELLAGMGFDAALVPVDLPELPPDAARWRPLVVLRKPAAGEMAVAAPVNKPAAADAGAEEPAAARVTSDPLR